MGNNNKIQEILDERGYSISRVAKEMGYARESVGYAIKRGWLSYSMWRAMCEVLDEELDVPHHNKPNRHITSRKALDSRCYVCHEPIYGQTAYCAKCRPEQERLDAIKIKEADATAYTRIAVAVMKQAFDDLNRAKKRHDMIEYGAIMHDIKSEWFGKLNYAGVPVNILLDYAGREGKRRVVERG